MYEFVSNSPCGFWFRLSSSMGIYSCCLCLPNTIIWVSDFLSPKSKHFSDTIYFLCKTLCFLYNSRYRKASWNKDMAPLMKEGIDTLLMYLYRVLGLTEEMKQVSSLKIVVLWYVTFIVMYYAALIRNIFLGKTVYSFCTLSTEVNVCYFAF